MNGRLPLLTRLALRMFVTAERREEVEGDLLELRPGRTRLQHWLDVASVVRECRLPRRQRTGTRNWSLMLPLLASVDELRYATRNLARRPGYTAVAALTLALGIGATVAIFTVVNAVLLRPLPYRDSDRLVEILHHAPGLQLPDLRSSRGLVAHYQAAARTLQPIAAYEPRQMNLAGGTLAERVRVMAATPNLFDVLGVRPAIGRPFQEADAEPGHPLVTLLSDGVWRSHFGADPGIVGRTLSLDGKVAEVVGVLPRDLAFPDVDTRLFVPLRVDTKVEFGSFGTVAIARLAPGATIGAARHELTQLQQRISEWFPGLTPDVLAGFGWSVDVQPLRTRVVASIAPTLWILLATVGLVLLVAAANVANLFLVRAESRQREVAVRAALGAGRGRIAAAFLAEGIVLASIGGVAGLLIAANGIHFLVAYGPPRLPRLNEVHVDSATAALTAVLVLMTAVFLTLLPLLGAGRRSLAAFLRDGGRGSTGGRGRHRIRQLLIVTQVAMALVLLVGAGLMLKSVLRLRAVDPGFRVDGLLTAGISAGARPSPTETLTLYRRILDELAHLPGVSTVGATTTLPLSAAGMTGSSFQIRSRPRPDSAPPLFTMHAGVTAGFFETLAVPLLEGRPPNLTDQDGRRPVAWVNRTFAQQFLDGRAVGERIKFENDWLEIVGVFGDLRTSGLADEIRPMVYLPLTNAWVKPDALFAVVRSGGDPAGLVAPLRRTIERIDPTLPVNARTMTDLVSASMAQKTFVVTLLALAAGIGLMLGIVGLYGAISYIAAQRTAEIGVRLALGARPASVCAMVVRQGTLVAAAGIAVGLAAAWVSARFLSSMLFGVSAHDPGTYAGVAVLLVAVSAAATFLPARRAAAIDPAQTLRREA